MRVYLESYGCAQNQGEGAAIVRDLVAHGHRRVGDPAEADVGVLVTCGVIRTTEARMVRRWRELSARLPRLFVTGCLVPLRGGLFDGPAARRTELLRIDEQRRLPELLENAPPPPPGPPAAEEATPAGSALSATAEVVIAQGCTSACSYCFSRFARGPLASVPVDEVVARVHDAVDRGAAEVRLTSLDTAAWGRERGDPARLPQLLRTVATLPGDFHVRVGMMSPRTLAPVLGGLLEALDHPRFYRFLHLPVQSGSDRVLAGMRRGYRVAVFREQVARARERFPDLTLATDLIVGFPGESEDDHLASEALLEELEPEIVNVTRFSPRPGTGAAGLAPLPPRVARRRSRALSELRRRLARGRLERWIGHRGPARVVEYGPSGSALARLTNYLPVVLATRPRLGSVVRVRVDGARSTYLLGRPTSVPV